MKLTIITALFISMNTFAQWSMLNNQLENNLGFQLSNSKSKSYIDQNWNVGNGDLTDEDKSSGITSKVYDNANNIDSYKPGEITVEVKWKDYLDPSGELNKKRKITQLVQNVGDDYHLVINLNNEQQVTEAVRCKKDHDSDEDGVNDVKNCVVVNEELCYDLNSSLKSGRLKSSLASINSCKDVLKDMSHVLMEPQYIANLSLDFDNNSDKIKSETEGNLVHKNITEENNLQTVSHLENMSKIIALCNDNKMGKRSLFSKRKPKSYTQDIDIKESPAVEVE